MKHINVNSIFSLLLISLLLKKIFFSELKIRRFQIPDDSNKEKGLMRIGVVISAQVKFT